MCDLSTYQKLDALFVLLKALEERIRKLENPFLE